jgi:uncharacterized protein YbjT (DUF2867 family)
MPRLIAVVGATGAQGGGLVRAILADRSGAYRARAITRRPESDKARALARQGAEVVAADLDHPPSVERAFAGAHAVFCVTNFWEHMSVEREIAQGTAQAHAAKAAGVEHAIWSTFEDTRRWVPLEDARMPTLAGRYKVPHFDGKSEVNQVFEALGVPTTFLLTSFYWDNFIHHGLGPKRGPDGKLALVLPMDDKKLPGIAAEDIGPAAFGMFTRGKEFIGRTVGIAGEHLTGAQMAAGLTRALGETVTYRPVPPDVFRGFGFPGAEDLGNMFQFKRDFNDYYCASRDVDLTRRLHPGLLTFEAWLARYARQIPLD